MENKSEQILNDSKTKYYFKVGTKYYLVLNPIDKFGEFDSGFFPWDKEVIIDHHGKSFLKQIPKYKGFCNVPSHDNFQQVINDCFNVYYPLNYSPQDKPATHKDCSSTLNFIKHIFGEKIIEFTHPKTKDIRSISTFDLALDYIQILYQIPAEKLPILCLVSKENNTGKTTFVKLLKQILGSNCAIIGNQDFKSEFNSHWAKKALVICDENRIDKDKVFERLNYLYTCDKISINMRFIDLIEIENHIKFILTSNNEEDFSNLIEDNIMYWVINTPVVIQEDPNLLNKMVDEIPAFLSFINQRKLVTDKLTMMWFHPSLLKNNLS